MLPFKKVGLAKPDISILTAFLLRYPKSLKYPKCTHKILGLYPECTQTFFSTFQ
ncbi:unnamed protein product [Staphylococcus haemolyticus JCSC1435]|uniref:Uncharacterized protein n=1 Tax=Staphylococcus haemolyticus (strain JCSC1435) TaxID=279808 RepID=Q4L421_STAHJ|nr:unnamed protein product [Staphylococcus haemolyticus JCSC1435]